jgi:hypothetical protein
MNYRSSGWPLSYLPPTHRDIVLLLRLFLAVYDRNPDKVLVTTADLFFDQHDGESWTDEIAIINLVGNFFEAFPSLWGMKNVKARSRVGQ